MVTAKPERRQPQAQPLRRKRASQRPLKVLLRAGWLGVSAAALGLTLLIGFAAVIYPAITGGSGYTILTRSMEPGMPPGSYIVVHPTPVEELDVGDIITFQLKSGEPEVVTHRISAVEATSSGEWRFVTKGDNNSSVDSGAVSEVQIRGRVQYVIPLIGFAGLYAAGESSGWITVVIATVLFAYATVNVIAWWRARRTAVQS